MIIIRHTSSSHAHRETDSCSVLALTFEDVDVRAHTEGIKAAHHSPCMYHVHSDRSMTRTFNHSQVHRGLATVHRAGMQGRITRRAGGALHITPFVATAATSSFKCTMAVLRHHMCMAMVRLSAHRSTPPPGLCERCLSTSGDHGAENRRSGTEPVSSDGSQTNPRIQIQIQIRIAHMLFLSRCSSMIHIMPICETCDQRLRST